MKRKWIACCSQTGSEILNISKSLNYYPDIVITNNSLDKLNPILFNFYKEDPKKTLTRLDVKLSSEVYRSVFSRLKKPLITLNGWLRIVPPDICDEYEIYNGHPGLIDIYPELKGKDPVQRVWADKDKYEKFGSVIHRVTAGVDEGEIILSESRDLTANTFEELDTEQRDISLKLWINFLKKYIK